MTVRGRTMSFDEEAVGRFVAQEAKSRIFEVSACLLYDRTDWLAKDWQVVQVIPSHRLLDDRLRVQGVAPEDIRAYQSWAHRLANYIVLDDADAREYYSMDLDDWVLSRPPGFFVHHYLPDDPVLYEEFNFVDFVQSRRNLIKVHLQDILSDESVSRDTDTASSEQGDQVSVEASLDSE
jgi:hypothetical protein